MLIQHDIDLEPTQLEQLAAPFPPDAVSWRVGSISKSGEKGMALAYIDARDVMDRLDAVMGADWQCTYAPMADGTACCSIGLRIDGEWRWRSDGAGMAARPDPSSEKDRQQIEMEQKGLYSDAFKRAAVRWGIARYLYTLPAPWVRINQWRQIEEAELPGLRKLLAEASQKHEWGDRNQANMFRALWGQVARSCQQPEDVDEFLRASAGTLDGLRVIYKRELHKRCAALREEMQARRTQ